MKRKNRPIITVFFTAFLLLIMLFYGANQVSADINYDAPKTLLVYDSLNQAEKQENDVQTIVRMLTALGEQVKVENMKEYKKGELEKGHYRAVITMINWPSMNFSNQTFFKDRAKFKGMKLHIGANLTEDEKKDFDGDFETLYQHEFALYDKNHFYYEQIGFKKQIELFHPNDKVQVLSYLKAQDDNRYSYGIKSGKNGYIPFFDNHGASLLATCEWLGKMYDAKKSYNPYIALMDFTPLDSPSLAPYVKEQLDKLENQIILSTRSTTQNTDLKAFKAYIQSLQNFTEDGQVILYLDVPAVNTVDKSNNDLPIILEQEISTMIEHELFPLGISAPTYWNSDKYYQKNALSMGKTVLLYQQTKNQLYHTPNPVSEAYGTTICAFKHDQLDNVQWNINGKYTDYTFPMPVALTYDYPQSKKAARNLVKSIQSDVFPPVNNYFYDVKGGITTPTQFLRSEDGIISLNGVPVTKINFDSQELKDARANIQADGQTKSAAGSKSKGIMGKLNNILTVVIVITLIVLTIMLIIGRRLYHQMFSHQHEANRLAVRKRRQKARQNKGGK